MPYSIYKIQSGPSAIVKQLEKIEEHEDYKAAKNQVRSMRAEQDANDTAMLKVIFAKNELEAEEQLSEKREAPILREWEK